MILSGFSFMFIILAIVFNICLIGVILTIHKNQIIIFDEHKIIFEWYILFKDINTTVFASEIRKIEFKILEDEESRNRSYFIIIDLKIKKPLKLMVIKVQYYDLMEYFKEFCERNYVQLVGYVKDDEDDYLLIK
jgi:hypothetical protein